MRIKAAAILAFLILFIFIFFIFTAIAAAATQKVLYTFTGGADGAEPYAGLIFDPAGNLYGVTQNGGLYNGEQSLNLRHPPAAPGLRPFCTTSRAGATARIQLATWSWMPRATCTARS